MLFCVGVPEIDTNIFGLQHIKLNICKFEGTPSDLTKASTSVLRLFAQFLRAL